MIVQSMLATLALLICIVSPAKGQTAGDADEKNIADLVMASHILANEGVMDSFGHATVRSRKNPAHFFMPRAMTPGSVTRQDIVELDEDCKPILPTSAHLNGERFIHCEIYKARPDVQSVIHTHDPAVLAFPLSGTPLQPVLAQSGFLPPTTPVFDIRDVPVPNKGMLVLTASLGHALAMTLGDNPVVLMRGHGDTVVGASVREATVRAIYTNMNAKAQAAAMALGHTLITLSPAELAAYDREERPDRPWENFRQRLPTERELPSR